MQMLSGRLLAVAHRLPAVVFNRTYAKPGITIKHQLCVFSKFH